MPHLVGPACGQAEVAHRVDGVEVGRREVVVAALEQDLEPRVAHHRLAAVLPDRLAEGVVQRVRRRLAQFLHVVPALRMATAGRVGVRELVDQHELRAAREVQARATEELEGRLEQTLGGIVMAMFLPIFQPVVANVFPPEETVSVRSQAPGSVAIMRSTF